MKTTWISVALAAAVTAGCAATPPVAVFPGAATTTTVTTQHSTEGAVRGALLGAAAGNVLGYITDRDRTRATALGALLGAGVGYWQGRQADQRLAQAQATAQQIAQIQVGAPYAYQPVAVYAAPTANAQVATFDRLETPLPVAAVRGRTADAVAVLNKLGNLAASTGSTLHVHATTQADLNFMVQELQRGAAARSLRISTYLGSDTRVIIDSGIPTV